MSLRRRLASRKDGFVPPKAKRWERWARHDPDCTEAIDHGAWARFLDANLRDYEDGTTLVAYGRVPEPDAGALDDYVNAMGRLPISQYARGEQLAYWINLYNARTVQLVLAYYPVDDLRQIKISPGRFPFGPWDKKILVIEGEHLSLNDVEHRILRPIWQDNRLHYALNRAAIGCPNLLAEPFTAGNTEGRLDQAARGFINHPRGVRIEEGKLFASRLYLWFEPDFGGSAKGVLDHLRTYAAPALGKKLTAAQRIDEYDYHWDLNEAP